MAWGKIHHNWPSGNHQKLAEQKLSKNSRVKTIQIRPSENHPKKVFRKLFHLRLSHILKVAWGKIHHNWPWPRSRQCPPAPTTILSGYIYIFDNILCKYFTVFLVNTDEKYFLQILRIFLTEDLDPNPRPQPQSCLDTFIFSKNL